MNERIRELAEKANKELTMTRYVHIVYVHPVELGEPNLTKVKEEKEFESHFNALTWVDIRNGRAKQKGEELQAVYYGRIIETNQR